MTCPRFFKIPRRWLLLAALLLSACQNTAQHHNMTASNTPIGIQAIEGVPPALQTGLRDGLAKGANQNGLKLTDHTDQAKLLLHGYMRVERSNNEFQGFLVFDIFDAEQNRLHRSTSSIKRSKTSGLGPESLMTAAEITQLGETAMTDLATYLSH